MDRTNSAAAAETFSECQSALDDRPIRQGDIIRFSNSNDPWEHLGVIVTGDCDIARNKHAGRLTYVPILTAHSYLSIFWLPRRLDAVASRLGERLVSTMRRLQQANLPEFTTPLTADRAQRWTIERGAAGVAEALRLGDGPDRDAFLALAQAYVDVMTARSRPFRMQCAALCLAYCATGTVSDTDAAIKRVEGELENYLDNLPGDALFLSCLASEHVDGYICYLRVLRDIGDEDIAVTPRQAAAGTTASRIAHLRSPYLYRLTQQLAEVFAAIGLPEEYEHSRSRYATILLRRHETELANGDWE